MNHSVLMFLAPAHTVSSHIAGGQAAGGMATRPRKPLRRAWRQLALQAACIAGDAMGLILFLAGLGLVLRLAEILLS